MLQEHLIRNSAPTLAGIKSGNLFRYRYGNELRQELEEWNSRLNPKGIFISLLKRDREYVSVYVYRKDMVLREMSAKCTTSFLSGLGYNCSNMDDMIDHLRMRMVSEDFPHEVGLFLGYPLCDVLGFINNCGRDCRFCGCWKVYENEHQTKEQFIKFKECRQELLKRFDSGHDAEELAVSF